MGNPGHAISTKPSKDEEQKEGHSWEGSLERSWDSIQEDEDGKLKINFEKDNEQKRRRMEIVKSVRKGLIRYLYVVIDLSRSMSSKDWKPTRCAVILEALREFIKNYLDQSPISHIGLIGIKGSHAVKLSDLSGNVKAHLQKLADVVTVNEEPSLQNALELAEIGLKIVPSYGSREILVIYSSLSTADPGDIFATATSLKREKIRCSFIGMGAEMHLLTHISERTKGSYHIVTEKRQLQHTFTQFTIPSPVLQQQKYSSFIEMGFPERKRGLLSLCVCHQAFTSVGYFCPRCRSKSCDIPTTCQVCSLPLVSSPHLARSYHHLFPIENFIEHSKPVMILQDEPEHGLAKPPTAQTCIGCCTLLHPQEGVRSFECPQCHSSYCEICDEFIHDSLHNCVGCQQRQ